MSTVDKPELLAAIGRALGLPHPYQEQRGDLTSIVRGGDVDERRGRVAWVEWNRYLGPDGWVYVWVNLAGPGFDHLPHIRGARYAQPPYPRVSVPLVTDKEHKVGDVGWVKLLTGDTLAVVYGFRGGGNWTLYQLALGDLDPSRVQPVLVYLGGRAFHAWEAPDGHAVVWSVGQAPQLYGLGLPQLTAEIPIAYWRPRPDPAVGIYRGGLEPGPDGSLVLTEQPSSYPARPDEPDLTRRLVIRLPSPRQRTIPNPDDVCARLRQELVAVGTPPPGGPDIVVAALATPFWDSRRLRDRRHHALSNDMAWFVHRWYDCLRTPVPEGGAGRPAEAAAWLAWLDELAAMPDPLAGRDEEGWDPAWSTADGVHVFAMSSIIDAAAELSYRCRHWGVPAFSRLSSAHPTSPRLPGWDRAWEEHWRLSRPAP